MISVDSLQLNLNEALRYMGFCGEADERTLSIIYRLTDELKQNISPKHIVKRFPCNVGDTCVSIDGIELQSKSLAKHLDGCNELYILAVTLGIGADNLIRRYSVTDIANSSMLQAISAALIEEYCDTLQSELALQVHAEQLFLTPRFSPGYGDLSINHQLDVTRLLQTNKAIGLTLSQSMMLIPTKSVTAIIGISNKSCEYSQDKCSQCFNKDCQYRNVKSI